MARRCGLPTVVLQILQSSGHVLTRGFAAFWWSGAHQVSLQAMCTISFHCGHLLPLSCILRIVMCLLKTCCQIFVVYAVLSLAWMRHAMALHGERQGLQEHVTKWHLIMPKLVFSLIVPLEVFNSCSRSWR